MLPIGGYVKISGMVDESLDTDTLESEPKPWEYRAKPVWQRMIVISAGVIMNIFLAIGIFWGINYSQGESLMQTTEIGAVIKDSPAEKSGLLAGDNILSINGHRMEYWEKIQSEIYFENPSSDIVVEIQRGGQTQTLNIPRANIPDISSTTFGLIPNFTEAVIEDVLPGKPAKKAGVLSKDVIISINGTKVYNQDQVIKIVRAHPSIEISLLIKRGEDLKTILVTPSSEGLIGISLGAHYTGPMKKVQYSLLESFPKGVSQTFGSVAMLVH